PNALCRLNVYSFRNFANLFLKISKILKLLVKKTMIKRRTQTMKSRTHHISRTHVKSLIYIVNYILQFSKFRKLNFFNDYRLILKLKDVEKLKLLCPYWLFRNE
ncbi:hypothetical protein L9F63_012142, partial [Diploptera punctata]